MFSWVSKLFQNSVFECTGSLVHAGLFCWCGRACTSRSPTLNPLMSAHRAAGPAHERSIPGLQISVFLSLCVCWFPVSVKHPWTMRRKHLQRGKLYFNPWFPRAQCTVNVSFVSVAAARQMNKVGRGSTDGAKPMVLWWQRSKKKGTGRGERGRGGKREGGRGRVREIGSLYDS